MSQHVLSVRTNLVVFAALMGLLLLTIVMAYINLGILHVPVAMTIAVVKAVLILLYFMHVRFSDKLIWVAAGAAFLWLGIMVAFTMGDYLGRGWLEIIGK